jgi:hypothetical protein
MPAMPATVPLVEGAILSAGVLPVGILSVRKIATLGWDTGSRLTGGPARCVTAVVDRLTRLWRWVRVPWVDASGFFFPCAVWFCVAELGVGNFFDLPVGSGVPVWARLSVRIERSPSVKRTAAPAAGASAFIHSANNW